jgi:hypothetical protein
MGSEPKAHAPMEQNPAFSSVAEQSRWNRDKSSNTTMYKFTENYNLPS